MKLSAYTYLFNARKFDFDLDGMVKNFTDFFDETVVATIPSEDDTYERLLNWNQKLGDKFRVLMTDISLSSNRFDGDLKTAALQECTKSTPQDPRCYVIMDGDETIPLSYAYSWRMAATALYKQNAIDGALIPVVDLYKDKYHAKESLGYKFRLHKDTVVRRGVLPSAELENGLFDTSKSDSTEPLLANGQLANFAPLARSQLYVLHWGHLNAERRAKLNREFWREHWKNRSGQEPNMALTAEEVNNVAVIEHGLPLE